MEVLSNGEATERVVDETSSTYQIRDLSILQLKRMYRFCSNGCNEITSNLNYREMEESKRDCRFYLNFGFF